MNGDSVSSMIQKRSEKRNADADRTTQALDNAANVAQYTPIAAYAKGYQKFRQIDNAVTGGKLSRMASKRLNSTAPGSRFLGRLGSSRKANLLSNNYGADQKKSDDSSEEEKNSENNRPNDTDGKYEATINLPKVVKWASIGVSCCLVLVCCCVICYSARQLMGILNIDLGDSVSDNTIQSAYKDRQSEIFDVEESGED